MSKKKKTKKSNPRDYFKVYAFIFCALTIIFAVSDKFTKPINIPDLIIISLYSLLITFMVIVGGKGNREAEKKHGVKIRGKYQQVYKNGKPVKDLKLISKVLFPTFGPWFFLVPFILLLWLTLPIWISKLFGQ